MKIAEALGVVAILVNSSWSWLLGRKQGGSSVLSRGSCFTARIDSISSNCRPSLGRDSVICMVWILIGAASASAQESAARLALEARLFYSTTGKFSANVLAPGGPELVNVVAGKDASTASLVTVVVSLANDAVMPSDASLRLTARERPAAGGGRILTDRSVALGAVARGGVMHAGFWLQGTGCRPVQLLASLTVTGRAAPVTATATVPFACAE